MGLDFESPAYYQKSSEINMFPSLLFYFQQQKIRVLNPRFFLVSNPLVTAKLPFIKGSPLLFSCVADVGKAADKPRGILQ